MPQPVQRDVYFSRPLTNLSIAYQQDASDFIADRVFPVVDVAVQGGLYYVYKREDWFKTIAEERAPASPSAGGGYEYDTAEYFARVYAVHKDVDDQTRANAESVFPQDREATQFVTTNLLRKRDETWIASYMGTGKWGRDVTGVSSGPSGAQFLQFDQSGSDPIEVIDDEALLMESTTGYRPNTLIMGPSVLKTLRNHSAILDRIKYTERGIVTIDLIAALFDVDRILVTRAVQNTAEKGQTGSFSFINDKNMLLAYVAPNPGLQTVSAGYTFAWTGLLGGAAYRTVVTKFRMEEIKSDRIEGEMAYQQKLVASDLGTYFASVVA